VLRDVVLPAEDEDPGAAESAEDPDADTEDGRVEADEGTADPEDAGADAEDDEGAAEADPDDEGDTVATIVLVG
jgi:hypothetical protein